MTSRINDVPSEIAEAVHTYDGAVVRYREGDDVAPRPCVVVGCEGFVPCPTHGTPVEDRGQWLWGRR